MATQTEKDSLKKMSIVIVDMPEEFINRDILKQHFEQYGHVERLACSVSKKYAVIHFKTQEEAENALTNGTIIRPDAPPLKIYHSMKSISAGAGVQKAVAPTASTSSSSSSSRVVTRRKIIRTFANPSPVSPTAPSPFGANVELIASNTPTPTDSNLVSPTPSKSNVQHVVRSSIKTSRPSPFLKKRPSFGDKTGKSPSASLTRNPFALPPRNMLSLDRRKKSPISGATPNLSLTQRKSQALQPHNDPAETVADATYSSPASSPPSVIVGDKDTITVTVNTDSPGTSELERSPESQETLPPALDIDETTADVENEHSQEPLTIEIAETNSLDEEDADTQDTAEATTEEEGEIIDDVNDEDYENEDEDATTENDDVYESPLKRIEAEKQSSSKQDTNSNASSSGGFSFKLAGNTGGVAASQSSIFKLPFTSPFSTFGDVPKPLSSSSFGNLPINPPFAVSQKEKFEGLKEKSKEKMPVQAVSRKPEVRIESEKTKPVVTGFFPTFASSVNKPVSSTAEPKINIPGPSKLASNSSSQSSSKRGISSSSAAGAVSQPRDVPNPLLLTFNPDTPEAQELFSKRVTTVEERYRILEARDKIIRSRIPKTKVNVEFATKLVGTCPDMCPEKERYMRQFQRQLVAYETLPGPDFSVDHQKAVKVYSRSSADQEEPLPHELRPGPTLDFTMHYLLKNIVPLGDDPDENLSDWYNFLWDRTRSIRKDITQQQIVDLTAVALYEKCARFHIHCASRLCQLDVHSFDPKLNDENLMKCLQSLEHLYEDLRRKQVVCPREPEFRAYQIMMNLNEGDALYNAQQLPGWILNSNEVQTALKLHHNIYTKNFVAFFRAVENLPYMTSCILHRYFFQVRSLALRCFMKAHCTLPKYETAMPMSTLQRMLGYGIDEAQSFSFLCEAHGIHCDVDENKIILKRKMFYLPEMPSIFRENHLVDSKLQTTVAEAINGEPLPQIDFASRKPMNSFTENGQLIPGAIVGAFDTDTTTTPAILTSMQQSDISIFSKAPRLGPSPVVRSFGSGGIFQQRKDTQNKPVKEIDAACHAAATKLIDESIKHDITELSHARFNDAKKNQERALRKKLQEEISYRVSLEWLEKELQHRVECMVRSESVSAFNTCRAVEEVSKQTASRLIEECVWMNTCRAVAEELTIATELYKRKMSTFEKIIRRIRTRFAFEKWTKFARSKKLEREMEQEKRRVQLWNFPAINPYSLSTKDVYQAFCGKSHAQPLISKVDCIAGDNALESILNYSTTGRPKRKSDGDFVEILETTPKKLPRMVSPNFKNGQSSLQEHNTHWDFPAVNPYSRSNHEVFEAFCGSSTVPVSAKITTFTSPRVDPFPKVSPHAELYKSDSNVIRRPISLSANGKLSDEIKSKASENTSDFLNNIQDFLQKVREESANSIDLDAASDRVDAIKKICPELDTPDDSESMSIIQPAHIQSASGCGYDEDMILSENDNFLPCNIFQHSYSDETSNLLQSIQHFMRQVKQEKAKSWNVDTFLNDIDVGIAL